MFGAAAASEGRGGGTCGESARERAFGIMRCSGAPCAQVEIPQRGYGGIFVRRGFAEVVLHRSESEDSGGAHGHRNGDGHRSGARADSGGAGAFATR